MTVIWTHRLFTKTSSPEFTDMDSPCDDLNTLAQLSFSLYITIFCLYFYFHLSNCHIFMVK